MRFLALIITVSLSSIKLHGQDIQYILQARHVNAINNLVFSQNGEYLFSSEKNSNQIVVWDVESGKKISVINELSNDSLVDFKFNAFTNQLLVLYATGKLETWDYLNNTLLKEIHISEINDVLKNFGTTRAIHILAKNKIEIVNTQAHCIELNQDLNYIDKSFKKLPMFYADKRNIIRGDSVFSIDKKNILLYTKQKGDSLNYKYKLLYQQKTNYFACFTILNNKIYSSYLQRKLLSSHLNGNHLRRIKFNAGEISFLSSCEVRNEMAIGLEDGSILLYNTKTNEISPRFKGVRPLDIESIKYSKDGDYLFIANKNSIICYDFKLHKIKTMPLTFTNSTRNNAFKYGLETFYVNIDSVVDNTLLYYTYYITPKNNFFIPISKEAKLITGAHINCIWDFKNNFRTFILEDKSASDAILSSHNPRLSFMRKASDKLKDSIATIKAWVNKNNNIEIASEWPVKLIETKLNNSITNISINESYKYVTVSTKSKLYNWDLKTGKFLFSSIIISPTLYLHQNGEGYYFGTKNMIKNLNYSVHSKIIAHETVDSYFNRPDIVNSVFPQHDSLYTKALEHCYKKIKKVSSLNLSSDKNIKLEFQKNHISQDTLALHLKTTQSNCVAQQIVININGVNEVLDLKHNNETIELDYKLLLRNGLNSIEIYATDLEGTYSNKIYLTERCELKTKPNLYLISLGAARFKDTTKNLNYANKDSKDIVSLFKSKKLYSNINTLEITDEKVTASSLNDIKKLLSLAKKNDVVIFFYAGHGLLDMNYDYYLATHETDFINPKNNSISYDSLELALNKCASRNKLLLIDACHSGDIEKTEVKTNNVKNNTTSHGKIIFRGMSATEELSQNELSLLISKELFAINSNQNGISIIGASMGTQFALESNKYNNGIFTYCIKQSFKRNRADYNLDNMIMLDELQFYITTKVEELTNGKQIPTTRSENLFNNIRLK